MYEEEVQKKIGYLLSIHLVTEVQPSNLYKNEHAHTYKCTHTGFYPQWACGLLSVNLTAISWKLH